jgi:hypothetical protein
VYTKQLKNMRTSIAAARKSLQTICDSTDYTERLSTETKFLVPAEDIFQGCATGLLQLKELVFAVQNLGVMCPDSYQKGLVYSQSKIKIEEGRAVMAHGNVNKGFQALLEGLKRKSCVSPWYSTTHEIWDNFLTFATQSNSKLIFESFTGFIRGVVDKAGVEQQTSEGWNDVLLILAYLDKIMDALASCARITRALLRELAVRLTDDQKILVSELYRMMRTVYLGMKVVTGNSLYFGLEMQPLAYVVYNKNLRTLWSVCMDVLSPFRLSTAIKQMRRLVEDAVKTQLVTPNRGYSQGRRTIEQYYTCWIGKLQARDRLLGEYGWIYNSHRFEEFLTEIAEESVSRIPEGSPVNVLRRATSFEARTICHGFLSTSPVRSMVTPGWSSRPALLMGPTNTGWSAPPRRSSVSTAMGFRGPGVRNHWQK